MLAKLGIKIALMYFRSILTQNDSSMYKGTFDKTRLSKKSQKQMSFSFFVKASIPDFGAGEISRILDFLITIQSFLAELLKGPEFRIWLSPILVKIRKIRHCIHPKGTPC